MATTKKKQTKKKPARRAKSAAPKSDAPCIRVLAEITKSGSTLKVYDGKQILYTERMKYDRTTRLDAVAAELERALKDKDALARRLAEVLK